MQKTYELSISLEKILIMTNKVFNLRKSFEKLRNAYEKCTIGNEIITHINSY